MENNNFIDMWYGNHINEVDKITFSFYPNEGEYRGNFYINGNPVGDYCTDTYSDIEKWSKNSRII